MAELNETHDTIVINDLLSFMACKVHSLSKQNLLYCLKNFYSKKEINEALKTFMTSLHSNNLKNFQKYKNNNSLDILYDILKNSAHKDLPVFVCKNLNNIPKLDSKGNFSNHYSQDKDLVSEQNFIKSQISEITSLVYQLKDQISILKQNKIVTTKQDKEKGLAYLQKLIDEEEKQHKGTLRKVCTNICYTF